MSVPNLQIVLKTLSFIKSFKHSNCASAGVDLTDSGLETETSTQEKKRYKETFNVKHLVENLCEKMCVHVKPM